MLVVELKKNLSLKDILLTFTFKVKLALFWEYEKIVMHSRMWASPERKEYPQGNVNKKSKLL